MFKTEIEMLLDKNNELSSAKIRKNVDFIKIINSIFLEDVDVSIKIYLAYNNLTYKDSLCSDDNPLRYISFKQGFSKYCSTKNCQTCSKLKYKEMIERQKQTCLEKYGTTYYNNEEQRKQTCLERYGVEYPMQSKEIQVKCEQNNLEKYGVKNPQQHEKTREKTKQTCLEKYGTSYYDNSEQRKQTCLEKYGVEHYSQSEEVKKKIKQTCLERHGVEYPMQSKEIQVKREQNNLDKYGVKHPQQQNLKQILDDLNSEEWWNQFTTINQIKNVFGEYTKNQKTVYNYINRYRSDLIQQGISISSPHHKIIDLLNEYNIEFDVNIRNVIPPYELDIYIPSKNLAIEVNGIYWHSELNGKDRNYHLNKLKLCEEKNIQLLQFWDVEIEHKWNIIKSMLLNKIGLTQPIYARKCKINLVSSEEEKDFLLKNHLQGFSQSNYCLGLFYDEKLLNTMSFGIPRYNKNFDWEIIRYCTEGNYRIIGGASKLFSYRKPGTIISYANRRYSQGNLYKHLGFEFKYQSKPSYWYIMNDEVKHRSFFQKHKLSSMLEFFNPNLTEWENMKNNGYDRIWDCGNSVFATA